MSKKYSYEIIINKVPKRCKEFTYDYSATKGKGIKIRIAQNAIHICANISKLYISDKVVTVTNHIFSDAIKKALLLHIILYSKTICIKSMSVCIDGQIYDIPISGDKIEPPIYSLILDELVSEVPASWQNQNFINKILSSSPSNQDSRWNAVFSTLCAKNKSFEIERFIYLWMAFNGIYGYFSPKINLCKLTPLRNISEATELEWFIQLHAWGAEHIPRQQSKRIADEVIAIIRKIDVNKIKSSYDLSDELKSSIEKVLVDPNGNKYNISAYGYLLVSFAYYFRCNVFHADKPLPLFCYADEAVLKCLHLINVLLEEFIDINLPLLFDDTYVDQKFTSRYQQIANHKNK